MSRRATVQPQWLDSMLMKWGRTMPALRGWYTMSPMFKGSIPDKPVERGAWELTPNDFDELAAAIDALEPKYRAVVFLYYKPWTVEEQRSILLPYRVSERTWRNWLHEAAAQIESHMIDQGLVRVIRGFAEMDA